jgi:hypothetical protein
MLSNACETNDYLASIRTVSLCVRSCACHQLLLRNIREHSSCPTDTEKIIHVSTLATAHAWVVPYELRDPLTAAYVTLKSPSRNAKGRLRDDPCAHGIRKRLKDVLMGPVTILRDPVTGALWGLQGPRKPAGRVKGSLIVHSYLS